MITVVNARRWQLFAEICLFVLVLTSCSSQSPRFGIAFISNRDGNFEIYRMTSDGQNVERLTNTPDTDEQAAVVSHDGRTIAFDRGGVRVERDIYTLNVGSGSVTRLADKGGYDIAGAWSPDNKQIAFVSDRASGYYRLYLMNSDGTNQKHIELSTDSERDVTNISWSPDGRYIVYGTSEHINTQQALTPTLFIADLKTQGVARLTSEELGACDDPDWSSDGKWIAMVCSGGALTDAYGELYIIRPDGTGFKQITTRPADYKPSFPPNSFKTWIGNPRWSPDGSQIAYIAAVNGSWNIYVTDIDGKNSRRLTDHNAVDWSISTYRLP